MSDEDPFDELEEEAGNREGDPFDRLGYSGEDSDSQPDSGNDELFPGTPADDSVGGDDPFDPETAVGEPDDTSGVGSPGGGTDATDSGPAFDLDDDELRAPEFDHVGQREGDPFETVGDAFTEMDVGDVDSDEVWQSLARSEPRESIAETQGRTYAEVSKHSYCEQCEYFSEPPEVECSHEGTEIVEFLDMETVRLVDCPIVAERQELREGE